MLRPPPAPPLYDGLNESVSLRRLMLEEGLSIAEIATRRGLKEAPSTLDALARGLVEPEAVIPVVLRGTCSIAAALLEQRASGEPRLKAVFELFEDTTTAY